jgi:predicted membrane-bound mannosyltransferase
MHEQGRFPSSTGFVMTRGKALLFVFPVLLAFLFRFPLLAQRPMHCDEAFHADKFGTLLEQGSYEYSTVDYHGPTLYYMSLASAKIHGTVRYADLSETTLRVVPAATGLVPEGEDFLAAYHELYQQVIG